MAGGYKSLEACIGSNFDMDLFISIWDGVQYVKDKYEAFDTRFTGIQTLNKDQMSRVSHDVNVALDQIGENHQGTINYDHEA